DQRVDLQQRQVALDEQLGQLQEDVRELLDLVTSQAQFKGQLAALVGQRAAQRVDGGLQNFLGRFVRNLLDLHAAFGGGHEHDTARGTVNDSAQIQLLVDVRAGLDQDLGDRLAVLVRLVGNQALA